MNKQRDWILILSILATGLSVATATYTSWNAYRSQQIVRELNKLSKPPARAVFVIGPKLPPACVVGDVYFTTTDGRMYICESGSDPGWKLYEVEWGAIGDTDPNRDQQDLHRKLAK